MGKLIWISYLDGLMYRSGNYTIMVLDDFSRAKFKLSGFGGKIGEYASLDDAKAAAQKNKDTE